MKEISIKFYCACFFIASFISCSEKINEPELSEIAFHIANHDDPNFPVFEITTSLDVSDMEWLFPENVKITAKKTVTHYFEKKGDYEVILRYPHKGEIISYKKIISIPQNSEYYEREEYLWWADEFEGEALNLDDWNYETDKPIYNNEWQLYTDKKENSFFRDGKFVIRATKAGTGQKAGDYRSARVTTQNKKELNRGRVEVRAKMPGGRGTWPAIWLFKSKWDDYYAELDMMEYVGVDPYEVHSSVHTNYTLSDRNRRIYDYRIIKDVEENFHTYGVNIMDGYIEFYIDHDPPHLVFTTNELNDPNKWPFDQNMFLILNVAVGGDWGGYNGVDDAIFPQEMEVDYVRIFKKMR